MRGKEVAMTKNIVNLTGKLLTFAEKDGIRTVEPSGTVPRVENGAVVDLPDPVPDVICVAPAEVVAALPERTDLFIPYGERFERVEPGRLCSEMRFIGFAGLTRNVEPPVQAVERTPIGIAVAGGKSHKRRACAAKRGRKAGL